MQGAHTGIDAAAERSCAAIGMEYSPGVVVTRRGASFASKVRRGAAVVALAALAAVVCILAIEGHRGGASADSLLWVRTRRLFKTYWEAPLNSAADDYVPYEVLFADPPPPAPISLSSLMAKPRGVPQQSTSRIGILCNHCAGMSNPHPLDSSCLSFSLSVYHTRSLTEQKAATPTRP
jgi:hypothetical protein